IKCTIACTAATARARPLPASACPAAIMVRAARWPAHWLVASPRAKAWSAPCSQRSTTLGAPCVTPNNSARASSCRAVCRWISALKAQEACPMKLRGLYAITDSQLLAGKFLAYVEAALDGGVTLLQYRDKSSDEARRLREAEKLRELCSRYKTQLIINDDAELAARLGVGVHLGQTDGPLTPARALLGSKAIIGATCHSQIELAEQAAKEGASYVAFGRFFNSNTKPGAPTADVALLERARPRLQLPIAVIGGITLDKDRKSV